MARCGTEAAAFEVVLDAMELQLEALKGRGVYDNRSGNRQGGQSPGVSVSLRKVITIISRRGNRASLCERKGETSVTEERDATHF